LNGSWTSSSRRRVRPVTAQSDTCDASTTCLETCQVATKLLAAPARRRVSSGHVDPTAALKDKCPAVRDAEVKSLAKLGPAAKDAAPALAATLKHRDVSVRVRVAYALAEIGPAAQSATPALREAAKDRDGGVRLTATFALKKIDGH
jgi:hypothetical protein